MEASDIAKRTGEIFKACLTKIKENFQNKFLF